MNKNQTEQKGRDFVAPSQNEESGDGDRVLVRLMRKLLDKGVEDKEAYLLVRQFDHKVINQTLQDSEQQQLTNAGGWIRSVIERKCGKKLEYPDTQGQHSDGTGQTVRDIFHKMVAIQAAAARALNPYTFDPYFEEESEGR